MIVDLRMENYPDRSVGSGHHRKLNHGRRNRKWRRCDENKAGSRGITGAGQKGCINQGSFKWEGNGFCLESPEGMCSTDTLICTHYTHLRPLVSTDVEQTLT